VATDSRIYTIIGLFCRIVSIYGSFAKETYNLKRVSEENKIGREPLLRLSKEDFFMTVCIEIAPPPDPLHPEPQIPRYKLKLNQNLNLNLYHEIPRNLSFSV